ncbi:MAG: pyruvate kinase [Micavibrio sp.]|nr:pyruvate kinase [Micavibrio sp.]|tara:strand:- start:971 stop:2416 length:1446 start_codon:yes stop_codon:yes gene_type:complete
MDYLLPERKNYRRKTKIVATLGPASSSQKMIEKLFLEGVNVFRVNFSHGVTADHEARFKAIRAVEKKHNKPIAILADLQGPKLRIGTFKAGKVSLKIGQKFTFDSDKTAGDETRVCLPHPEVIKTLKKDSMIYLDDGNVRIKIIEAKKDCLIGKVIAGSKLSDRKGFNLPNVLLPIPALTTKDIKDLKTALDLGADWIAQSFVQTVEDVRQAKKLIKGRAALMAKIEKPAALANLEGIIKEVDGIMIARGDLGVEMPPEDVPPLQKQMVDMARSYGKPVIVATQMLESMVTAPVPTRAEASDVATAIYDGTDAVMLSAETASGQYPCEAVAMMRRIAKRVEQDGTYRRRMQSSHQLAIDDDSSDAISVAADDVADTIKAVAIVTYTTSGTTALRAARQRPSRIILSLTQNLETARRLSLSYGARPVHVPEMKEFEAIVQTAIETAKRLKYAKKGDDLVITAGVPFGVAGSTNTLRIVNINK